MTKRELWLAAMKNVAEAHHALIVTEYDRLCEAAGFAGVVQTLTPRADMVEWAKRWVLNDRTPGTSTQYPRTIMCIKEVRAHFNISLREAKDVGDEAVAFLRANGSIT